MVPSFMFDVLQFVKTQLVHNFQLDESTKSDTFNRKVIEYWEFSQKIKLLKIELNSKKFEVAYEIELGKRMIIIG